ncbi:MAG: hypothetical protein IPN42_08635 [Methylococcaceae bacterium]|nr:hypothetical protein [Methylococcaceae bacterium]
MPAFSPIFQNLSIRPTSSPHTGLTTKPLPGSASLTFPVLVSFLLCAFKGSLQTLLDDLFATLEGSSLRTVSKSAVSQARQKLKATAFEALNDSLIGLLNERLPEPRWQGLRLVATDSTTFRLPPWLENREAYGVQTDSSGQPYVLVRVLGLFHDRLKADD